MLPGGRNPQQRPASQIGSRQMKFAACGWVELRDVTPPKGSGVTQTLRSKTA